MPCMIEGNRGSTGKGLCHCVIVSVERMKQSRRRNFFMIIGEAGNHKKAVLCRGHPRTIDEGLLRRVAKGDSYLAFLPSRVRVSRRFFGLSRPLSLRQGICNLTVVSPESVAFRSFATLPVSGSGGASVTRSPATSSWLPGAPPSRDECRGYSSLRWRVL